MAEGGEGGDYYSFVVGRKNFFIRYLHAVRDTYWIIRDWVKRYFAGIQISAGAVFAKEASSEGVHPDLGLIQLNGQAVPMRFTYWNRRVTSEQLLGIDEWKTIRAVLTEFQAVARANGIIPIIVFIPTKVEVYGSLFSEWSGQRFLERIRDQLQFEKNSSEALETIAQEQEIRIVNLLPHFKELARQGKALYYPFDTHWNIAGRQAAAEVITKVVFSARE